MNSINRLFSTLFFFVLLTSCNKSVSEVEKKDVEPAVNIEVTSFGFSNALNSSLSEDLLLVREGDAFSGKLPSYLNKKLIPTFKSNASRVLVNNVEQKSGVNEVDFSLPVTYTFFGENGERKNILVNLNWHTFEIPQISIQIDGGQEVVQKDKYLKADLIIKGNEMFDNYVGATEIRGRGNSTWGYEKKPYRLRLAVKSDVLGIQPARNWVLLANYLDPSLMCNTVAMRIGKDLNVPFTNTVVPVDLTINNVYRGSYVLTQHLEVGPDRIDINSNGLLLEMDDYYDEEFKFKSASYKLPVMIKSPELKSQSEVGAIQSDFEEMELLVASPTFPNNGYREKLDIDVFTRFFLVNFLTGNEEINHPKSTYLHKKTGGKFSFGPIWDFDWAYGFEGGGVHFTNYNRSPFWNSAEAQGSRLFQRLMTDPEVKKVFKENWVNYKKNHFNKLLKYIDEYSVMITESHRRNAEKWNSLKRIETEVVKMKEYLNKRADYIDSYVNGL